MPIIRRFLKVFVGLLAGLVILICAALLTINLVDWNRHKQLLIGLVERVSTFKIDAVDGIEIKLWRSADLQFSELKLHNEATPAALKSFASGPLRAQVAVLPLLKRRIIVEVFTLEGARLKLQEVKKTESPSDDQPVSLASLPAVFINLLQIKDSEVSYGRLKSDEPLALSVKLLNLTAPEDGRVPFMTGQGRFNDLPWEMLGETGRFETFVEGKEPFPLWLHAKVGQHELDARSKMDFSKSSGTVAFEAKGPDLEQIKQLFRLNLGSIPPYELKFNADFEAQKVDFTAIDFRLGKSDIKGVGGIELANKRPKIKARLESQLVVQSDWAGLFKTDKRYKDKDEPAKAPGQYFSDKPIDASVLKAVDLDVKYLAKEFRGEKSGRAVRGWDATLGLEGGDLKLDPVRFVVAAGTIGGSLLLDARKVPMNVHIQLGAKRVDLQTLLGPIATEIPVFDLKPKDMARGLLTGQFDLKMQGQTPMAMVKSLKGPIELAIEEGALSSTVIEAFGLDVTQTISSWLQKHPLYEMPCTLMAFQADQGAIKAKTFLIATKDTSIIGKGGIDLVGNKIDVLLEAHPHDFSIGSIRSPLYIEGPLSDIKMGVKKTPIVARTSLAVALGALVNPLAALVPLIETGLDKKGKCSSVSQQIQEVQAKASKLSGNNSRPKK